MSDEAMEIEQPLPMLAADMLRRADDFFASFKILALHETQSPTHVAYFLVFHATELYLKAFLTSKGVTLKEIRKENAQHDLVWLFNKASNLGFPQLENFEKFVDNFNTMNDQHDLRYPKGYILHLPHYDLCIEMLDKVKTEISGPIQNDAFRFSLELPQLHGGVKKFKWKD
jgi:hypothetical protein